MPDPAAIPPARLPRKRRPVRALAVVLVLIVLAAVISTGALRVPAPPASGGDLPALPLAVTRPSVLRLATYNIHSGVGADGKQNLDRIAADLRGYDLIGLNEVRGKAPWHSTDQAELLGEKLHLSPLFAPTERRWWNDSFGNGLLTARQVLRWRRIPLAGTPGRGCRNVLMVQMPFAGQTLTVLITHIDRLADRQPQIDMVKEMFLSVPTPAVLMGDFNTAPTDPIIKPLLTAPGVTDAVGQALGGNLPSHIDWILVRGLKVSAAGLRDTGASDHPLAWAEVEVPQ